MTLAVQTLRNGRVDLKEMGGYEILISEINMYTDNMLHSTSGWCSSGVVEVWT